MDVLGHMLDETKYKVKRLPKGGCMQDQTFVDDTTLYLKGTQSNMDRMRTVLYLFCLTFGAKINWGKFVAIWASKEKRDWEWGQEVGLKWVPKSERVRYLGIQISFWLVAEANFDIFMTSLKGKMIMCENCNLSLTCKILITNQVMFSSMWYMAACWNPNPRMCNQIRGVVRNFIWGGKVSKTRAKVKWDSLMLPLSCGNLESLTPKHS